MVELSARQRMIEEVKLRLGFGLVDIELDPPHYELAIDIAVQRYRQRSSNAVEESFVFLNLQPDVDTYTLPPEVQEVRSIYRRTIGGTAGGAAIDPFSLAFTNNIYMIQNPGGLSTTGSGMLATYDFAMQYQSLVGRMFGRDILYTWNSATKRLVLHRKFTAVEEIMLHCFNAKPESILLVDVHARPWLRDYTVAACKQMLGEARGKFGALGGPQGGVTLNGEALKTEAQADMERLDKELAMFVDQDQGWPFLIG